MSKTIFQSEGYILTATTTGGELRLAKPDVWTQSLRSLPAAFRPFMEAWALAMQAKLDGGAELANIWWDTSFEVDHQDVRANALETAIMILAESGWPHGVELRNLYYRI